jgi:hypothetical protein
MVGGSNAYVRKQMNFANCARLPCCYEVIRGHRTCRGTQRPPSRCESEEVALPRPHRTSGVESFGHPGRPLVAPRSGRGTRETPGPLPQKRCQSRVGPRTHPSTLARSRPRLRVGSPHVTFRPRVRGYGAQRILRCMKRLPGWAVDDRTAIEREAAPYRGLPAEERTRAIAAACRAAARQLANRPDRERLVAYRDPLPASSVAILHRLRAAHRNRR